MPENVTSIVPRLRARDGPPHRVCVVSDDVVTQLFAHEALGFLVPQAQLEPYASAEDVLRRDQRMLDVALFLVDDRLPGASGVELIRALRARPSLASVPMLLVLHEPDPHVMSLAWHAGAADVATMPLELYELGLRMRNLIQLRPASRPPGSGPLHVMVVEDDPANAQVVRDALTGEASRLTARAIDVTVAGDAEAAMALMRDAERGAAAVPQLLVVDHHLPGLGGIELVDSLSAVERWRALPVLLMTVDAGASLRWRAYSAGATEFVRKPLDPTEFALRVRNLLALGLDREPPP